MFVCGWMHSWTLCVCVCVFVQTTIALDWPLGSALAQPVVQGKRGFEPLPVFAVNRLCIHSIFNDTEHFGRQCTYSTTNGTSLPQWMWRIIRLFYSSIYIMHDERSNHDDDIYIYMYKRRLCYWCVCKSRYFADPQTKRISIYGIL
jgi:hypothetical protein